MENEKNFLVAVRANDAAMVTRNSEFTKRCFACSELVALAPSSLKFLDQNPDAIIACSRCIPTISAGHNVETAWANGDAADLIREASDAVPNQWRARN